MWRDFFLMEEKKDYYCKLKEIIRKEYQTKKCYPPFADIFNAFTLTKEKNIKCVIIGQDPYHTRGYAQGLSFSVPNNLKISPSLANIFKELENDLGIKRTNSDLTDLALEGVFLLNASLSVEERKPNSHMNYWKEFTDNAIKYLEKKNQVIVYILWGNNAREKKALINNPNHYVIESAHPSPLGAYKGFFGSKPFSKCNKILEDKGVSPIKWG